MTLLLQTPFRISSNHLNCMMAKGLAQSRSLCSSDHQLKRNEKKCMSSGQFETYAMSWYERIRLPYFSLCNIRNFCNTSDIFSSSFVGIACMAAGVACLWNNFGDTPLPHFGNSFDIASTELSSLKESKAVISGGAVSAAFCNFSGD